MSNTLVLATEGGQLGKAATLLGLEKDEFVVLAAGGRALAEEAAAIASNVTWIDTLGQPAENFAAAIAQEVKRAAPKAVIAVSNPAARSALGVVACSWEAPTISNAISARLEGESVIVEHLVLDDKVIETVEAPAPAVVLVNPLALKMDETTKGGPAPVEEVATEPSAFVEIVSSEAAEVSALQDAEIVVAVGKGIGKGDSFNMAKRLSEAIGAEMACSRPVASDLKLMPHDRHVGISGKHIEPNLYIALGISGYPQHVLGMKNSRAVVVVNNDPKAFFFENADYGIVGDVEEVIPELERALKNVL